MKTNELKLTPEAFIEMVEAMYKHIPWFGLPAPGSSVTLSQDRQPILKITIVPKHTTINFMTGREPLFKVEPLEKDPVRMKPTPTLI